MNSEIVIKNKYIKYIKLIYSLVQNKEYDKLYKFYGRRIYNLLTPYKYKKNDINRLIVENDIKTLLDKYGFIGARFKKFRLYNKSVMEKILKENRFFELQKIYGDKKFYLEQIIALEKFEITNKRLNYICNKTKHRIKNIVKIVAITSSISFMLFLNICLLRGNHLYNKGLNDNTQLIEKYDEQVKQRAEVEGVKDIYDVVILNYANGDMVGHTGVIPAAIKAVSVVDECVGEVYEKVAELGGTMLITADHGNAEMLIDDEGNPFTAHTTNQVPLIVTNSHLELKENGKLGDLAPTMLQLLGLKQPKEMDGESLIY